MYDNDEDEVADSRMVAAMDKLAKLLPSDTNHREVCPKCGKKVDPYSRAYLAMDLLLLDSPWCCYGRKEI